MPQAENFGEIIDNYGAFRYFLSIFMVTYITILVKIWGLMSQDFNGNYSDLFSEIIVGYSPKITIKPLFRTGFEPIPLGALAFCVE